MLNSVKIEAASIEHTPAMKIQARTKLIFENYYLSTLGLANKGLSI